MSEPMMLYPLNDLVLEVELKIPDPARPGHSLALTTGTATAFLSTGNLPTSIAADATLNATATHIAKGWWRVVFESTALQPTLLATLFATSGLAYVITTHSSGVRVYAALTYSASRPATVVS